MNQRHRTLILGMAAVLGVSVVPGSASACGGFFCSQAQGVNQAAERIVFANNDDGTVTAVIEIQYQGPSDKFSWLLPISSVPTGEQLQVGSSLSFQRLQQATNPQYSLTTRVEGTCDEQEFAGTGGTAAGGFPPQASGGEESGDNGVTVEASGHVGSFEWAVISLDQSLSSPAAAAVSWLGDNGYDVPAGAPGLLGPYLEDGLFLLALKLEKGANAGSIRPIVLTYEATKPMIPIKLTAVAANENMGVMTWVLGKGRAVPQNYYGLELNDARINWFNPNSNYNDVVTAAADEAGGQGFVTEYAQPGTALQNRVWFDFEESDWKSFLVQAANLTADDLFIQSVYGYSQWDGFWDVVRKQVQLPAGRTLLDVQDCPDCYRGYIPSADFLTALETDVIEPARVIQKLIDEHQDVTRLYSTLSAEEMTVDPLFAFNPDLPTLSNLHTAERVIECARGYYPSTAPWRIELPQGGVVRGGPTSFGQWPTEFAEMPANRRVLRLGESGKGQVVEDNSTSIDGTISVYSAGVPMPPKTSAGAGPDDEPGQAGQPGSSDGQASPDTIVTGGGCACSLGKHAGGGGVWLGSLALALLLRRRRRDEAVA
jgi:MYXO-CTERM domain-containing protein